MKQFELDILSNTFKRCYGLAYCTVNKIHGYEQELANQTGFRLSFIKDNISEIIHFAEVRITVLNPC